MYTGAFTTTTVYGNWAESIEVWDTDTDTLYDTDGVAEIQLVLRDPVARFDELTLKKSTGGITTSAPGLVEWNVAAGTMGTLPPKTYEVIILFIDEDNNRVPIALGSVSVVE